MNALATATVAEPLARDFYPCTDQRRFPYPLVLLHGWGGDSRVWQPLIAALNHQLDIITVDLPGFGESDGIPLLVEEQLYAQLADALPARCYLLGWSLGGMLAVQLAYRCPGRVVGLMTVAANASFVQRDGWPWAMAAETFAQFCSGFAQAPDATHKQFTALQAQGEVEQRSVLRKLRAVAPAPQARWLASLELLGQLDNRLLLPVLALPSLHLFGAEDALVDSQTAPQIANASRACQSLVIEGCGHAPHVTAIARVVAALEAYLGEITQRLDKRRVADSFSKAAPAYDSAASLQRQVGHQLLLHTRLPDQANQILDLGCGTGYFAEQLLRHFPDAQLHAADLATGMLDYARGKFGTDYHWLCADAESLPYADASFELVFSNFTLQWCQQLDELAAELYRVMQPSATLALCVPGPDTLKELKSAWRAVDNLVHVNRFFSGQQWLFALKQAGFRQITLESSRQVRQHDSVLALFRELKTIGAHNANQGKASAMTSKGQLQQLQLAYEPMRDHEGQLPATWEVLYLRATR